MNKLGHFEENLLAELRTVVAARAGTPRPARSRGRLALTAASVVAAGLLVGVPALNGAHAPAVDAITVNDDGTISIDINHHMEPEELEQELAAYGITADVSFLPWGTMCNAVPARFQPAENQPSEPYVGDDHVFEFLTVRPSDLEGQVLVLEGTASGFGTHRVFLVQYAERGPVAPCVPVAKPAP